MKKLTFLIMTLLVPLAAYGGQIYGSVREGERHVRQGIQVEITCQSGSPYVGQTDAYGAYSINVRETGRCTLKVVADGCAPTFQIYSENDPVRYDFVLIRQSDGQCVLQRR